MLKFCFVCENMKKQPSKVAHNWPQFFFQYCQPAQNQPESQLLFHKNCSLHDLCIMTLHGAQVHYVYIQVKKSMTMGRFHAPHVTNCLVHKASEKFLSIFTKGICRTSMTTLTYSLNPHRTV